MPLSNRSDLGFSWSGSIVSAPWHYASDREGAAGRDRVRGGANEEEAAIATWGTDLFGGGAAVAGEGSDSHQP
ncbi:hypothetical protein HOK021_59540 [Streptomyces hygroscopicus]|nr:hypothetical protein HOK021_59540 [Streptomyces hygroscopicus]